MKRFLKVLPVILAGGLALTACGSVDVGINVNDPDTADVHVSLEGSKQEIAQVFGAASPTGVPDGVTAGLLLENTIMNSRKSLGAPESVTFSEHNDGDEQKAEATVSGVALGDLPTLAMGSSVAYDSERYSFTGTRPANQQLGIPDSAGDVPMTLEVTFPQQVATASNDGEVAGNTVSWDLTSMPANTTFTAVTYGPGVPWWISVLLWVAGLAVMGLLTAIAIMSGRQNAQLAKKKDS